MPEEETVRELHGLQCPKCGSDEELEVEIRTMARLSPDGTDSMAARHRQHVWDDDSRLDCRACDWSGTVAVGEEIVAGDRFRADDGIRCVLLENGTWVDRIDPDDRDMTYQSNERGWPVDRCGEPLDGELIVGEREYLYLTEAQRQELRQVALAIEADRILEDAYIFATDFLYDLSLSELIERLEWSDRSLDELELSFDPTTGEPIDDTSTD